jgi:hypothetical protein
MTDNMRHKFSVSKNDAKRRGIEFLFTFEEWRDWWLTDDRWPRRGRGGDKLVMARNGDTGPYAPWNVHCCTYEQNQAEISRESYVRRGTKSAETRRRDGNFNLAVRGAGHPRAKRVRTPAGEFESGWLAADHMGVSKEVIYSRIKAGWPGYAWIEKPLVIDESGSATPEQFVAALEHYARGRNSLTLGRAAVIKLDAHRRKRV